MLSIKQCRKILGQESILSDAELEFLRDQLYAFADIVLEAFIEMKITLNPTRHPEQDETWKER